jgi:hypothetical protein
MFGVGYLCPTLSLSLGVRLLCLRGMVVKRIISQYVLLHMWRAHLNQTRGMRRLQNVRCDGLANDDLGAARPRSKASIPIDWGTTSTLSNKYILVCRCARERPPHPPALGAGAEQIRAAPHGAAAERDTTPHPHTHTYTHIHTHKLIHTHTHTHSHTHTHTHVPTHTHIYTYTHIRLYSRQW